MTPRTMALRCRGGRMTTLAFIAGAAIGAIVTIGILAHRHFAAMHARPQDDRGQPTYDRDGNLTGWL